MEKIARIISYLHAKIAPVGVWEILFRNCDDKPVSKELEQIKHALKKMFIHSERIMYLFMPLFEFFLNSHIVF